MSTNYSKIKYENRNRIYNNIRKEKSISRSKLMQDLQLSMPTVIQNIEELIAEGIVCESGSFGHTGGRRAKAYSIVSNAKIAIGLDITKNHITTVAVNLSGEIIFKQRERYIFSLNDDYLQKLGKCVDLAVESVGLASDNVLGVAIVLPALITNDCQNIFYGNILGITGVTCKELSKYINFNCRLYNDADAAGYGEVRKNKDLDNVFYISLSNNIGGAVLINHEIYKGEGPRSGEIGHMTIIPNGERCYCGQNGCFEEYCNARILSDEFDGNLQLFFEELQKNNERCKDLWQRYLYYLSIAVNNIRMLFDCKVILGGYVGAYIEEHMEDLKKLVSNRNSFENNADYLIPCTVKQEALGYGGALAFIEEFSENI